ncbi:hypothetical protein BGZ58_008936 [Dissophora ornata]|nr:hypothetical protein BGZ58_008936 [Dissophora ornata]
MIRNSAARHASAGIPGITPAASLRSVPRPRRRPGTHVIVAKPSIRGFTSFTVNSTPARTSGSSSTFFPVLSPLGHGARKGFPRATSKSSAIFTHPHVNVIPSTSSSPFSTSTVLKKKHGSKPSAASTAPAATVVEGDVVYRKEGSKIVPVASPADQIDAPISGLFSQYEDLSKPSTPPPEITPPKTASSESVDISALTLKDVFPPDEFVKQLIQQKKFGITLDETKQLVQTMVDILPLREDDPKRLQVEKDFANNGAPLAFALLKIAVDSGDIISRYSYGAMLYRGAKGVPADPVKGRAIIESLAKPSVKSRMHGLPWAMSTLASIYARDDKNYEAARDMYLKAANAGVVEARVSLGRMYLSGELPRDSVMARKCFEMAVKADENAEASFLLGSLEMNEEKPNFKTAFQHYQKAASKGLAEAQYNVGQAYFRGLGVAKNDALAVEYWKMSGQQGFGLAQLSLGAYYFQDETPQEQKEGVEGEGADTKAVKHVWDPSKKDLMQAQKWFTLASRRPGVLGLEGKRLKGQVDEQIKHGGGGSRNGRPCVIM